MKNIIALVLLLASAGAAYWFGIDAWNQITISRARITEVDGVAERIEEAKSKRDEIVGRYNAANAADVERLKKLFPERIDEEEMYVLFEQAALQTQMTPERIVIASSVAAPSGIGKNSLSFEVIVSGTYENVRRYINVLENNIRLMDIASITVSELEGSIFTISITGSLYYGG